MRVCMTCKKILGPQDQSCPRCGSFQIADMPDQPRQQPPQGQKPQMQKQPQQQGGYGTSQVHNTQRPQNGNQQHLNQVPNAGPQMQYSNQQSQRPQPSLQAINQQYNQQQVQAQQMYNQHLQNQLTQYQQYNQPVAQPMYNQHQ